MWLMLRHLLRRYRGSDSLGNRYYESRQQDGMGRTYRWVSYGTGKEASNVPSLWHAWLHHTIQDVPQEDLADKLNWIKPHHRNLTGTNQARLPAAHVLLGSKQHQDVDDYEPWIPGNQLERPKK